MERARINNESHEIPKFKRLPVFYRVAIISSLVLSACEAANLGTPYTMTASVSAYTDCDPGMRCDGITKSGKKTSPGTLACRPGIPLESRIEIPGWGTGTCLDHGNEITNSHVDIWFANRDQALQWGRQQLEVTVYPKIDEPVVSDENGSGTQYQGFGNQYTVRRGDTLSGIAGRFGTCVAKLARKNSIGNANLIFPGQVLTITGPCD